MNQSPKTSQTFFIIISILAGMLIPLAGFGVYKLSQPITVSKPSMTNSASSSSLSSSLVSGLSSNSTVVSANKSQVVVVANSSKNIASISTNNSTDIKANSKILSCPNFDIAVNTDKYKVGFDKFVSSFMVNDPAYLESAKQAIRQTQTIRCQARLDDNPLLVQLVNKNYELPCWFCGGNRVQSLSLSLPDNATSAKTISTNPTKSINNLDGTINKMSAENMTGEMVNYNVIAFKIKDVSYEIRTESSSSNPTEAENAILLKDALELFNSITVK